MRIAATIWAAVEPEFLVTLGWNSEERVLSFPREHTLLGRKECAVEQCGKAAQMPNQLCVTCHSRWQKPNEMPWDTFLSTAKPPGRSIGGGRCAVPDCPRPWKTARLQLCPAHEYQQRVALQLPLPVFVQHPDVVPLAGFGLCLVAACPRDRIGKGPYCHSHQKRWRDARQRLNCPDEERWRRTTPAIVEDNRVSLRGLPDRVAAEVVFGLQERTKQGVKNNLRHLRPVCNLLRVRQVESIGDLEPTALSKTYRGLLNTLAKHARQLELTPDSECHKDIWDLSAFGLGGTLRFTGISQPWLREATKQWAFDDLPRRRGGEIRGTVQSRINSIAQLSASLRLQRDDDGNIPTLLRREDITAFCNRLAFLTHGGTISAYRRIVYIRDVRNLLVRMRVMGLAQRGNPLAGLAEEFIPGPEDIPDEPEDAEAGKDLPAEVMRHLCDHLQVLERRSYAEIRVAVELLIDTGRRPEEICQLALDCLDRDGDGKPVLVYDNIKSYRNGRRLPITEATAAIIVEQQRRVRDLFPGEPNGGLKLLPAPTRNPYGRRAITDGWVSKRHREWVDDLPDVIVPMAIETDGKLATKMLPFDKKRIFPYTYRHSYAQRHADSGVPVDVLRELMDHRLLETTQRYYRVGEERRRDAVERVTTMQFDRHGNRVWRQVKALLDSEHTRRAVGEVAVPYGGCSEPSNVAAGGDDCPLRFRCIGCGHFTSNISYLPDLERYLADLLRHRERLAATLDADEWAKTESMPSDDEIKRVRRLIDRMKADLDELTEQDRAQIEEAVAVVRRSRAKVVGLGMPQVRQPVPDIRPERSA
jgi:integrase